MHSFADRAIHFSRIDTIASAAQIVRAGPEKIQKDLLRFTPHGELRPGVILTVVVVVPRGHNRTDLLQLFETRLLIQQLVFGF